MEENELTINVFDAALLRIDRLFNTFDEVCVSLSGGKCSTVLLHLAAAVAKANNKKLAVLFIDWEAHHVLTINHIHEMKKLYADVISHFYWIALPLSAANDATPQEPEWLSWEDGVEWWRIPPSDAITDRHLFPFYRYGMAYDSFITEFHRWLSATSSVASLLGTTAGNAPDHGIHENTCYGDIGHTYYPLFDWHPQDLWLFNSLSKAAYNPLYDLMYRSSAALIQEPFEQLAKQEQLRSAHHPTYRNVPYCDGRTAHAYPEKPLGHTWHSYASFLLNTMPHKIAEQYRTNITRYLHWHQTQGYCRALPDEQKCVFESNGIASWEKICAMILDNDYRCQALTISEAPATHCNIRRKVKRARGNSDQGAFL